MPEVGAQSTEYQHLGRFSNWVEYALRQEPAELSHGSDDLNFAGVRSALGFGRDRQPVDPHEEGTWVSDGVVGEEISWGVGYGPRTRAWLLRPEGAHGPLPGVLALHDHSNFKFLGKEKIADGPSRPDPLIVDLRRQVRRARICQRIGQRRASPFSSTMSSCGKAAVSHWTKWLLAQMSATSGSRLAP